MRLWSCDVLDILRLKDAANDASARLTSHRKVAAQVAAYGTTPSLASDIKPEKYTQVTKSGFSSVVDDKRASTCRAPAPTSTSPRPAPPPLTPSSLPAHLRSPTPPRMDTDLLKGQTVVVTGVVPGVTRSDVDKWLVNHGAVLGGSVTGALALECFWSVSGVLLHCFGIFRSSPCMLHCCLPAGKTTILLVATEPGENKIHDANKKKAAGQNIQILNLAEFEMLFGKPAPAADGGAAPAASAAAKKPAAAKAKAKRDRAELEEEGEDELAVEAPTAKKPAKAKAAKTTTGGASGGAGGKDSLRGKTVVVTGSFPGLTRAAVDTWLAKEGATLGKSVTGATDIVVVADDPGANKVVEAEARKAKGQAIEILNVVQFGARFGLPGEAEGAAPKPAKPENPALKYLAASADAAAPAPAAAKAAPKAKAAAAPKAKPAAASGGAGAGGGGGALKGHTIVVTGTVPGVTRAGMEEWITAQGGVQGSGVTAATTIVLVADKPGEGKIKEAEGKKAKGQAIDILNLTEFQSRFGLPSA